MTLDVMQQWIQLFIVNEEHSERIGYATHNSVFA